MTTANMGGQSNQMSQPPPPTNTERERRLAEALRANLRKRKAQSRDGKPEKPAKD